MKIKDFFHKGTYSLRKEIAIVVIVKLVAISIIWYICFSNPIKDYLNTGVIQQHIFGETHGRS